MSLHIINLGCTIFTWQRASPICASSVPFVRKKALLFHLSIWAECSSWERPDISLLCSHTDGIILTLCFYSLWQGAKGHKHFKMLYEWKSSNSNDTSDLAAEYFDCMPDNLWCWIFIQHIIFGTLGVHTLVVLLDFRVHKESFQCFQECFCLNGGVSSHSFADSLQKTRQWIELLGHRKFEQISKKRLHMNLWAFLNSFLKMCGWVY